MRIIILGAGQVETTLAENLVSEDNDITLINVDAVRLAHLQDKHDLKVIRALHHHREFYEKQEHLTQIY